MQSSYFALKLVQDTAGSERVRRSQHEIYQAGWEGEERGLWSPPVLARPCHLTRNWPQISSNTSTSSPPVFLSFTTHLWRPEIIFQLGFSKVIFLTFILLSESFIVFLFSHHEPQPVGEEEIDKLPNIGLQTIKSTRRYQDNHCMTQTHRIYPQSLDSWGSPGLLSALSFASQSIYECQHNFYESWNAINILS